MTIVRPQSASGWSFPRFDTLEGVALGRAASCTVGRRGRAAAPRPGSPAPQSRSRAPKPGPGEVLVSILIGRDCSSHSLPS
jgi:hypothetical protein